MTKKDDAGKGNLFFSINYLNKNNEGVGSDACHNPNTEEGRKFFHRLLDEFLDNWSSEGAKFYLEKCELHKHEERFGMGEFSTIYALRGKIDNGNKKAIGEYLDMVKEKEPNPDKKKAGGIPITRLMAISLLKAKALPKGWDIMCYEYDDNAPDDEWTGMCFEDVDGIYDNDVPSDWQTFEIWMK